MLFLGHEFEEHMYPILLSDWSIPIVTYFYGIFTAKKWNFTTKSDLFSKKTIPMQHSYDLGHARINWMVLSHLESSALAEAGPKWRLMS